MIRSEPLVNSPWIPLLCNDVNRLRGPSSAALYKAAAKRQAALEYKYLANVHRRNIPTLTIIRIDIQNIADALLAKLFCSCLLLVKTINLN